MSDDYDDLYDITNLDDGELKELVLQQLREYPDIDVDLVEVEVERGNVRLAGRVGTEQEVQTVEHVVTDLIGGERVRNELVIFDSVRGERSEAADDAFVEDMEADPQISVGNANTSDEAQHLVEDLEAEHFGTHDPQQATERGTSYEPPDRGIQQGTYSIEDH
ncbi:MAG TPA: BON domain-containing protein [Longimicrobiales bacterium]